MSDLLEIGRLRFIIGGLMAELEMATNKEYALKVRKEIELTAQKYMGKGHTLQEKEGK